MDRAHELPTPVGWADVATKQDLELLSARFDTKFAQLEARIQQGFAQQSRWVVGAMLGLTAIFSAVGDCPDERQASGVSCTA